MRLSLYAGENEPPKPISFNGNDQKPYFLTVGGGDRRKNTEAVVSAVERLVEDSDAIVSLKVVGHYGDDYKSDLWKIAGRRGSNTFLEFVSDVDDASLKGLYAGAVAVVAPSFIEGFSLPVVEAAVCGVPVIASQCDCHRELIVDAEALFPADSPDVLAHRLEAVLKQPSLRERLRRAQSHLPAKFHESAVAGHFWNFVVDHFERRSGEFRAPAVVKKRRAKVAFLSPFPPDESGVATYTEKTLAASPPYFDADLYTDAPRPVGSHCGFRDAGPVTQVPFVRGGYDAVISAIGNSPFHTAIFE